MKTPTYLLLLATSIILIPNTSWAATSISVRIDAPTGSASREFGNRLLRSMTLTPCLTSSDIEAGANIYGAVGPAPQDGIEVDNPFDQFSFEITGSNSDDDDDGFYDYDLYVLLVNLSGDGSAATIAESQFFVFSRYDLYTDALTPGVVVYLQSDASALDPTQPYLRAEDFIDRRIDETLLGGSIAVDNYSLAQGTWLAVAILGTEDDIDFQDPRTWAKWDAEPFLLGAPWDINATCDPEPLP